MHLIYRPLVTKARLVECLIFLLESGCHYLTFELSSYEVVGLALLPVVVHSVETVARLATLQFKVATISHYLESRVTFSSFCCG